MSGKLLSARMPVTVCPPGAPVAFPAEAGRADAPMTGQVVRESVTVARRAERARVARTFEVAVLDPGHPCGDDAVLLVSELFGNSVVRMEIPIATVPGRRNCTL